MLCVGEDADGAVPRQGRRRERFRRSKGGRARPPGIGTGLVKPLRNALSLTRDRAICCFLSLVKKIRMDLRCHIRKTTV